MLMSKTSLLIVFVALFVFVGFASGQAPWVGRGDANDPYQIWDANDLTELGANVDYYSAHFKLMADVNLSSFAFTKAVIASEQTLGGSFDGVAFTGVFDGGGFVIRNITINAFGSYLGLFGKIGSGGIVKNVGVVNASISYGSRMGILAGENSGTIIQCYSSGSVSAGTEGYLSSLGGLAGSNSGVITRCHSSGSVYSFVMCSCAGGLVGRNESGTISFCYSNCLLDDKDETYDVGGLVGTNYYGNISDCYAAGTVTSGNISSNLGGLVGVNWGGNIISCYAVGAVTKGSPMGGLTAYNSGTVSDSYWDIETSGLTTSAGGTGKTTEEMKEKVTFTNWDFFESWCIEDKQTYPLLRLMYPSGDLNYDGRVDFKDIAVVAGNWLAGIQPEL